MRIPHSTALIAFAVFCLACDQKPATDKSSESSSKTDHKIDTATSTTEDGARVSQQMVAGMGKIIPRDKGVATVSENIQVIYGFASENSILVSGPAGKLVINTGRKGSEGSSLVDAYEQRGVQQIDAFAYTSFEQGMGAKNFQYDQGIPVYGLEIFESQKYGLPLEALPLPHLEQRYRSMYLEISGGFQPKDGPDAAARKEVVPSPAGYLTVNRVLDDSSSVQMAGMDVKPIKHPGGLLSLYFTEMKTLVTPLVTGSFPNPFTAQRFNPIDPEMLLEEYQKLRNLNAENMISTRAMPVRGEKQVLKVLNLHIDALSDLLRRAEVQLMKGATRPGYSTVDSSHFESPWLTEWLGDAREAVWSMHFSKAMAHLPQSRMPSTLPSQMEESPLSMLTIEELKNPYQRAMEEGKFEQAAELATQLLHRDRTSADFRQMAADAYRAWSRKTSSNDVRNACLARASALEGRTELPAAIPVGTETLRVMDSNQLFGLLPLLCDIGKLPEDDLYIEIRFGDTGVRNGFHMRNGNLEWVRDPQSHYREPDAVASLTRETLARMLFNKMTPTAAAKNNVVRIDGYKTPFVAFMETLAHPNSFAQPLFGKPVGKDASSGS